MVASRARLRLLAPPARESSQNTVMAQLGQPVIWAHVVVSPRVPMEPFRPFSQSLRLLLARSLPGMEAELQTLAVL